MYEVGQLIVYGASGVCRVEAVEHPTFVPKEMKDRLYYRLKPLYDQGTLYTPVDTANTLRPVITREEADALIRSIPQIEPVPCASHSPQLLGEHYKSFFQSHRCEDLMTLLKTIYSKLRRSANPRAASKTDQHYLKKAEELLYNELAVALELPVDEVKPYIVNAVGGPDGFEPAAQ